MLKLKEVVDKQRDEIRAKALEISSVSKEVEAVRFFSLFLPLFFRHTHTHTLSHEHSHFLTYILI